MLIPLVLSTSAITPSIVSMTRSRGSFSPDASMTKRPICVFVSGFRHSPICRRLPSDGLTSIFDGENPAGMAKLIPYSTLTYVVGDGELPDEPQPTADSSMSSDAVATQNSGRTFMAPPRRQSMTLPPLSDGNNEQ